MTRWKPDARGRLEEAAMELYRERGFDRTTVAEIAARAGLTERTFFRYFADKREVLFSGSAMLTELLVDEVAAAPASMPPIEIVAKALEATSPMFDARRDRARQRQQLIEAHAELRERELIKLASLAAAIDQALRARGVPASAASLAAEAGMAVFKSAFARWIADTKAHDLAYHLRDALADLKTMAAATAARPPRRARVSKRRPAAARARKTS